MRKIILTVCTFYIHTFTNSPQVKSFECLVDSEVEEKTSLEIINLDDTLIKKGGIHSATWYNPHGARTASGEKFHRDSLTCAYNFSKMGTYLKVTNISSQKSVTVKITDRMGNKSRNLIDLSKCAFDSIGNTRSGRIKVIVEEIKKTE